MASEKLYPRPTLKRIMRAHTKLNVGKNVDILIFLDYILFLRDLMREAAIYEKSRGGRGKGGKGGSAITGRGVRRVVEGSLRKFKG